MVKQRKDLDIELKKEYLGNYKNIVRQMERSELKILEMRLGRMMPTVINDGMPHAHKKEDLSSYIVLLDQEEKRYMKYRYQRIKKCKEITDKIEKLDNEDEKDVLTYRYIKFMKWEDMADKMGYSWQHLHKIHLKALKNFIM